MPVARIEILDCVECQAGGGDLRCATMWVAPACRANLRLSSVSMWRYRPSPSFIIAPARAARVVRDSYGCAASFLRDYAAVA